MPLPLAISLIYICKCLLQKRVTSAWFSELISSLLFLNNNLPKRILMPKRHFEAANSALQHPAGVTEFLDVWKTGSLVSEVR